MKVFKYLLLFWVREPNITSDLTFPLWLMIYKHRNSCAFVFVFVIVFLGQSFVFDVRRRVCHQSPKECRSLVLEMISSDSDSIHDSPHGWSCWMIAPPQLNSIFAYNSQTVLARPAPAICYPFGQRTITQRVVNFLFLMLTFVAATASEMYMRCRRR